MRTTLDLPEDLFRQVKAKAALEGTTLKNVLKRYIENGLRQPSPAPEPRTGRSALPTLPKRGRRVIPNLTPELQAQLEEEQDRAKLSRSFGR